jgi:hypothetical protein
MQVLAKSAVAYAVAQEVLRVGGTLNVQMRVATGDTVVSGIHIPEGTNVWLCARQVCTLFTLHERSRSPCAATCMHKLLLFDTNRFHAPHSENLAMSNEEHDDESI